MNPHMPTFEERAAFATVNGYFAYKEWDGRWHALMTLMYTTAIVGGKISTLDTSVEERWCFTDQIDAVIALVDWENIGYSGEPHGWIREPYTGRRRPNGEPSLEYIDP